MRILIAGCGYLGAALCAELTGRAGAAGAEIFALRRSAAPPPPGAQALRADLCDPGSLRALPSGIEAAIFAAAPGSGGRDAAGYLRTYVEGPRNLLAALAQRGGLRRLLYISSTAIYERRDGGWVDEDTPAAPAGFRGRLLLEGERAAAQGGHRCIVLRLGGLYGPGRNRLLRQVARGEAAFRPRYTNRIHRADAAGAAAHLLRLDAPRRLYLGVDAEPAPEEAVLRWLAAQMGAPAPAAAPRGAPPINKRCSSARLQRSGYALRFPSFRQGYAALLAQGAGAVGAPGPTGPIGAPQRES
ncbi:MAG: NAD-dependent epimerase/dehydratase family protein [Deltaproteobacteria bacterium]|nr:NAD-dependent epimerase/dehydratase family protein [Deltaproteobacteria bacterium]